MSEYNNILKASLKKFYNVPSCYLREGENIQCFL